MLRTLGFITLGALLCTASAYAAKEPIKPLEIAGTKSVLDLKYLPEWRYSGDPAPRRDFELKLNLYLPPTEPGTKLPLVMFVHGGAYSAGHKDESYPKPLFEILTKSGFAVASLNYILVNKGIFPQVFWDFEDASRFLRRNAERYNLDPTAFGAMGISAGGWLITTSGHADGDTYFRRTNQGIHFSELSTPNYVDPKTVSGEDSFLRPILAVETAYPGTYGRFQAMAFDFSQMNETANGFTPALLEFVGQDYTPKHVKTFATVGVNWTPAIMTHPKFHGNQIHVPKLTKDDQGEAMAKTLDGKGDTQLADVIRDWFKRELIGPEATTPVPEIWPAMRLISGPTEISMIVPAPTIRINYTTDGSAPTDQAPVYTHPFKVEPGTKVRAIASMAGRKPSHIVTANFHPGPVPLTITAPLTLDLPAAITGKSYRVEFKASAANARWCVQGDLRPYTPDRSKTMYYPNGMLMDGNGVWSGTPTTPGVYWVQIWVNDGPGRIAGFRNYRWTITGAPIGPQKPDEALTGDTNIAIATLKGWRVEGINDARDALQSVGIRAVFQDDATSQTMLLVPTAFKDEAKRILTDFSTAHKLMVEWPK